MSEKKNNFKRKLLWYGKKFARNNPRLRPFLVRLRLTVAPMVPTFSGWGMQTEHELPWIDEYQEEIFRKACIDIKKQLQFNKSIAITVDEKTLDGLEWRHWNVSYSIRHAIKFTKVSEFNFVECGVGEGMSIFFAMREIMGSEIASKCSMHLYDSWGEMKEEFLLKSEISNKGRWKNLQIDDTKRNLEEFTDHITYHQGYIPESFKTTSSPPTIVYLHIDLNSAKPTLASLEFFYPRLVSGGVILFDDYGWQGYEDTKKMIDKFFSDKPGIIMKLPTGQAIYFQP